MKKKKYSSALEDFIVEKRLNGASYGDITSEYKVSTATLHTLFKKHNVLYVTKGKRRVPDGQRREIIRLKTAKVKTTEVAERFNISICTVNSIYRDSLNPQKNPDGSEKKPADTERTKNQSKFVVAKCPSCKTIYKKIKGNYTGTIPWYSYCDKNKGGCCARQKSESHLMLTSSNASNDGKVHML